MRFQEKLRNYSKDDIWQEYCGFLDMTMDEFMGMQKRLLLEQVQAWSGSTLGRRIAPNMDARTIDSFRRTVPLTTYDDYADFLLRKEGSCLPAPPVLWIQTTWEGGLHPMKTAPYSSGMLDTYKHNMMASIMLSTSKGRGDFDISVTDHMLYALAPLPYATGLMPLMLKDEIDIEYLPPVKDAAAMSFRERNKKGFKMGLKKGIEFFFGLGSVTYYISQSISSLEHGSGSLMSKLKEISPRMLLRYLKAKRTCKKEKRAMLPRDLFQLKGFTCAGTDNWCYRDDLEKMWGVRPTEIFAGTEPTCIGTEIWTRDGMYFFPDACFYEFIPESEMRRNLDDPSYNPRTILMDQVQAGEKYELVITVLKGGAFVRYRVGDVYRCVGIGSKEEKTHIPRFTYVDRVPTIIDIAGFTRITENSINHAVLLSGLPVKDWFAVKEYTENNRPKMHMYLELERSALSSAAVSTQVLREHLGAYFQYLDNDYKDLQKILGVDPLELTVVKCGSFDAYAERFGGRIHRMNPGKTELIDFLSI